MNAEIAAALPGAFERREFAVHYQPQIDLISGELVGVEALMRWHRYPPNEFIPVAEATGLIVPIGNWVCNEAVRQLAEWDKLPGMPEIHMAVNFSKDQLADHFVETVTSSLKEHAIQPGRLTLELTETVLMTSGEAVADLYGLHELGVYIALDDFGTGYSSLAYLRELPVELIKIDQRFVSGGALLDQPVIDAIMSLASTMGLHVVAEGVETGAQACGLVAVGCQVGQGFLFGRALKALDIPLAARRLINTKEWCKEHPYQGGRGRHSAQPHLIDELMHQIDVPQGVLE